MMLQLPVFGYGQDQGGRMLRRCLYASINCIESLDTIYEANCSLLNWPIDLPILHRFGDGNWSTGASNEGQSYSSDAIILFSSFYYRFIIIRVTIRVIGLIFFFESKIVKSINRYLWTTRLDYSGLEIEDVEIEDPRVQSSQKIFPILIGETPIISSLHSTRCYLSLQFISTLHGRMIFLTRTTHV